MSLWSYFMTQCCHRYLLLALEYHVQSIQRQNVHYIYSIAFTFKRYISPELREYEGVYKVSGLAAWSENCKCYRSLPLGAVV
jgi:hypothetical protein